MYKKIKERLYDWKRRFRNAGFNQCSFCKKYGYSTVQMSRWINGKTKPDFETIDRIEEILESLNV